ncbi:MAG: hypothetical protein WBO10_03610 [Pyrinomonadaceae bacterium]
MKAKNISAVILVLILVVLTGQAQEFTLTTSQSNIISSKASIARPGLDGNPNAIIVATPLGDTAKNNPHPIGAWYYKDKWNIFNTDHAVMPVNMRYKIEYSLKPDANHFLHIAMRENISEQASYIDNPAVNNNPAVQFLILQNYAPDDRAYNLNASETRASYNSAAGKWYISNVNGKPMFPNTAYSVVVGGVKDPSIRPLPVPTPTSGPIRPPVSEPTVSTQSRATGSEQPAVSSSRCTNEMAWGTVGKWARQRQDAVATADPTFPKIRYKTVLDKAQKVVELFKLANPEFKGIEAHAYRGIHGRPVIANGPVPFRLTIGYGSYICVGNESASVEKRGTVILYGGYGSTVVEFNSLRDVFRDPLLSTADGEEIFGYQSQLGKFHGHILIEPIDNFYQGQEALVITPDGSLPYKPVSREQYLLGRIKVLESGTGMLDAIAGLKRILGNMSTAERQSPALVRDVTILPGNTKLFAAESEGGRHLVTIDNSYFNAKLPRDTIQLITVHWHANKSDRPKVEMVRQFKENFDFDALAQMLGK